MTTEAKYPRGSSALSLLSMAAFHLIIYGRFCVITEAMGSDIFVRIVGQCLADHRDIFREEERRRALVDCLDAFIEAGWPSARRLIYRLPELFD